MNQIRFSFSLRHGHPQESIAIKKLLDIPTSRRAALIRSWISNNLSKMPGHFDWSDARESIHPPAKFSLYLDPLAPDDGPSIDAINRIPAQFLNDWVRERICAAQSPNNAATESSPVPSPAITVTPMASHSSDSQQSQRVIIETELPKKQSALGGLFS